MTLKKNTAKRPNILMIMVDQMRFPPAGNDSEHGFVDPLKHIFGFQGTPYENNEFKKYFPGFWALRNNAVVMNNHHIASSACVPSRTVLFTGQYGTRTGVTETDGLFKDGLKPEFSWLEKGKFPTLGSWMRENDYSTHYFGKWHMTGEETRELEDYGFSDWELSSPDPHGTLPNNLGYFRDYQFDDLATSFLRRQGIGMPYNKAHAKANFINEKVDEVFDLIRDKMGDIANTISDDLREISDALSKKIEQKVEPSPGDEPVPWFAVSSFTNPHDIASYPGLPSYLYKSHVDDAPYTLAVPPKGAKSALPIGGTMSITLNPNGFPQNNANVPYTWNENLAKNNKPNCQFDYKYKMGLALVAKSGRLAAERKEEEDENAFASDDERLQFAIDFTLNSNSVGLPFALTDNPELASRSFLQYYGYLLSEVDQHISNTLKALEESGQADNTIVVFCPDHGEYGASHGTLMEKWHSAYEEVIHVPMVVRFPPGLHHVPGGTKQVNEITSHIDILPTIMGLSGANKRTLSSIKHRLADEGFTNVMDPVGIDLSSVILGKEDQVIDPKTGQPREGVLFMTYDTITEPLRSNEEKTANEDKARVEKNVTNESNIGKNELTSYEVFVGAVDKLRANKGKHYPLEVKNLAPASVIRPNKIVAVIDNEKWKLVEYFEDSDTHSAILEYELYDLNTDPNELLNLVEFDQAYPTFISNISEANKKQIKIKARTLMTLLTKLKAEVL